MSVHQLVGNRSSASPSAPTPPAPRGRLTRLRIAAVNAVVTAAAVGLTGLGLAQWYLGGTSGQTGAPIVGGVVVLVVDAVRAAPSTRPDGG